MFFALYYIQWNNIVGRGEVKMEKRSAIRTIYLYIFTIVGLVLLIIGGVRFIDMGLKAFIFTAADEEQRLYSQQPPMPMYSVEYIDDTKTNGELTVQQKQAIDRWLMDYEAWEKRRAEIDPITAQRHRDASISLAMILVGTPLYIYHWGTIRKESKQQAVKQASTTHIVDER